MADNLDVSQGIGNFSIEDTLEMSGVGNAELIKDLLGPETSTSSPDEIQDIQAPPKAAPKAQQKEDAPEKDDKPESNAIQDFLLGAEDDDEDGETAAPESKAAEPKAPEEEGDEEEEGVNQFSALAKDLTKLGVFTQEEGEEDINVSTPEEFLERFQAEKKRGLLK